MCQLVHLKYVYFSKQMFYFIKKGYSKENKFKKN